MWSLAQWLPLLLSYYSQAGNLVLSFTVSRTWLPTWCSSQWQTTLCLCGVWLPALSTGLGKHHIVIIPERSPGVLVIPAIPWGIRGPEKACDLPEHMLQHPGNAKDQYRTAGIESTFRCKFSLHHWENWGQKENSCPRSHSELGQVGTWAHGCKVLGSVIKSQALGQLSFLGFGQICFLSTHTYTVRCILGYSSWNGVYSCMFGFHGSLVVWH